MGIHLIVGANLPVRSLPARCYTLHVLWFWAIMGPALAVAWASLRGERKRARYYATNLAPAPERLPPTSVIVPVKGPEEGLALNLASLAALDYPDYELIVVARDATDIPAGVVPAAARVVLAGTAHPDASEKAANLLAGVAMARPESEVFAFADSDGRVRPGWLRALVAPLEHAGAATGYRWYLPEPPDFASLLRSVWNAGIFGQFGPGTCTFAWGGAMAIRRDTLFRLRIPEIWKTAVSDDYALSTAVRAAGLTIRYAPGAVVASSDHVSLGGFFSWARRQLVLTRVFAPRMWWMAAISSLLYSAGMAAAVLAIFQGVLYAEYALLLLCFPAMLKGTNRAALARAALPDFVPWFKRYSWVHTWWAPLACWAWLLACLASARTRVIEWRGRRYHLRRVPYSAGRLEDDHANRMGGKAHQ